MRNAAQGTRLRFLAFALLGLLTQAAVTLFVAHAWLQSGRPVSLTMLNAPSSRPWLLPQASRSCGYRLAVFTPRAVTEFRQQYALGSTIAAWRGTDLMLLALLATVARLAFVDAAPVAYGDAINYSWVASVRGPRPAAGGRHVLAQRVRLLAGAAGAARSHAVRHARGGVVDSRRAARHSRLPGCAAIVRSSRRADCGMRAGAAPAPGRVLRQRVRRNVLPARRTVGRVGPRRDGARTTASERRRGNGCRPRRVVPDSQ